MYKCVKCQVEIDLQETKNIPRSMSCSNCETDIKSCIFCKFYDESKHNECSEPSADRVVDKEKANFCDYYEFDSNKTKGLAQKKTDKEDKLKALDDLFK